jgi:exonuclease III
MFAVRRHHGLRIDRVLASEAPAARCTACHIEREPAGPSAGPLTPR